MENLALALGKILSHPSSSTIGFRSSFFLFLFLVSRYPQSGAVNKQVTFTYGVNHDVWIHPTGTCDETGKIALGALGGGPVTYEFTATDVGNTITFACDTADHCEEGQIINFNVGTYGWMRVKFDAALVQLNLTETSSVNLSPSDSCCKSVPVVRTKVR